MVTFSLIGKIFIAALLVYWVRFLYGYFKLGGTLDRRSGGYSGGHNPHPDDFLHGSR